MTQDSMLPEELVWDGEHPSELAITAMSDLQMDILPANVLAHLETCPECSARIGEAALLSMSVGQVWQEAPKDALHPVEKATYPVPWRALFGAGFLSMAGMVPVLATLPKMLVGLQRTATHSLPVVAHVTVATSSLHGTPALIIPGVASVVLIAVSVAVAHVARARHASTNSDSSPPSSEPRSS